jgi:phospholipase A1
MIFAAVIWVMSSAALISPAASAASESESRQNECLLKAMKIATPDTLVELRRSCQQLTGEVVTPSSGLSGLERTIRAERQSLQRSFTITPHRPNFLLPFTHNSNPNQYEDIVDLGEDSVEHSEAEFQVSMKFPLAQGVIDGNTDLLVAYTGHSWWQVYNDASAPFRETNHEPEIFLRHYGGPEIFGTDIDFWDLGFVHESNGRSDLLEGSISRSWNRIYGTVGFEFADVTLALKAWYRIPEDEDDDDNPDLHQYRGYGQIRAIWAPNKHTFSAMYRPGTKEDGLELSWSYPLNNHMRFYTKYYSGYGESLLDYDHRVERIGIGFTINDYIQN